MAAEYLRDIRIIQPEGPYRLAGWSAGGTITYEIAQQLMRSGTKVQFLGLIDTLYKDKTAFQDLKRNDLSFNEFVTLMPLLILLSPDHVQRAELDQLAASHKISALLAYMQAQNLLRKDVDLQLIERLLDFTLTIGTSISHYRAQELLAPVHLFIAVERKKSEIINGWRAVIPSERLQLVPFPANHYSIMTELHLRALGHAIATALTEESTPHAALEPSSDSYNENANNS